MRRRDFLKQSGLAAALGRRLVFPSEKRGADVGLGRKGKGTTLYVLTDGHNLPLGVHLAGADRHESPQVIPLIERAAISWGYWPRGVRLLYDKAADSDPLRERAKPLHSADLSALGQPQGQDTTHAVATEMVRSATADRAEYFLAAEVPAADCPL